MNKNIEELKVTINKLNKLIAVGEAYVRIFNEITSSVTMDQVPNEVQEYYLGLLQDLSRCRMLKNSTEKLLLIFECGTPDIFDRILCDNYKPGEICKNLGRTNAEVDDWVKQHYKKEDTEDGKES